MISRRTSAKLGRMLVKRLGCDYILQGAEQLKGVKGGVVLINHQSFLDLLVLCYLWPRLGPTAVICKKELMYIFPFGLAIWSYGSIFVDRSNSGAARASLERAATAINQEQKKLLFFPEGTRSTSATLLPFKSGAFATAFANGCPVIPIAVSRLTFLDHANKRFNRGTGVIRVMKPVHPKDFDDIVHMRNYCQSAMQTELDDINSKVQQT